MLFHEPYRLITNYDRYLLSWCHIQTGRERTTANRLLLCLWVPSLMTGHHPRGYCSLRSSRDMLVPASPPRPSLWYATGNLMQYYAGPVHVRHFYSDPSDQ